MVIYKNYNYLIENHYLRKIAIKILIKAFEFILVFKNINNMYKI
jgi:hypothetical protein